VTGVEADAGLKLRGVRRGVPNMSQGTVVTLRWRRAALWGVRLVAFGAQAAEPQRRLNCKTSAAKRFLRSRRAGARGVVDPAAGRDSDSCL